MKGWRLWTVSASSSSTHAARKRNPPACRIPPQKFMPLPRSPALKLRLFDAAFHQSLRHLLRCEPSGCKPSFSRSIGYWRFAIRHTRHLQACLQLCALALSTTGLVQLKIEADSLEDRLTTMQPEMEAIGRKLSEEATQWQEVPAASTAPPR